MKDHQVQGKVQRQVQKKVQEQGFDHTSFFCAKLPCSCSFLSLSSDRFFAVVIVGNHTEPFRAKVKKDFGQVRQNLFLSLRADLCPPRTGMINRPLTPAKNG
ncbi:hypothetical protein KV564_26930 [Paenibacillus chitinolyticus]|nr:hypothetical protein [Paenibacillus chitinolyticus]